MLRIQHFFSIIFCILLISIVAFGSRAQDTPLSTDTVKNNRPHNIILEAAGPGFFFSVNYDTRFANRRDGWGMRGGLGGVILGRNVYFTIPVQLNYLLGAGRDFLELGVGATYGRHGTTDNTNALFGINSRNDDQGIIYTGTIGYRFQPLKHGINFGASFNPLYIESEFRAYGGFRMGWTF
jgi:hypothetical protein